MFRHMKKLAALVLSSAITFTSAAAFTGTPTTQFDYILQKIEQSSLYTQNNEMPSEQVAEKNAYIEQNPDKLQEVINEYLQTLDTHSMFLTKEEYEKGFSTLVETSGIGVTIQKQGDKVIIIDIEKASPAAQTGLTIGDEIKKIDGVSIENMEISQMGELLRGETGSQVKVTVLRNGQTIDYTLTRAYIRPSYVSSYTVDEGIEYIRIEAMGSESDLRDFDEIWNGLDEKSTKAVILDLRSNGGGLVDVALEMADIILEDDGTYMGGIQWREDNGGFEKFYSRGTGLPLNEICVLVDENTASAAELLAGILKETGTAEIVGTTTYGKGQGQYHFDVLGGQYRLIVTCMEMNLPQTGCWEGKGITPTVEPSQNNNVIDTALNQLPAIDSNATISYGDKSEQVQALSGRLYLLGYMDTIQDVFDTNMLSALRAFQKDEGLTTGIFAGQKTFEKLEEKINKLKNVGSSGDAVYDTAVEICQKAASEPLRYVSLSDGSYKVA